MTFEEYSEKNKKGQNASGEAALDDHALNAVAGGAGDVGVDVNVGTTVEKNTERATDITIIKDDHSNHSIERKYLKTDGGVETDGTLSF